MNLVPWPPPKVYFKAEAAGRKKNKLIYVSKFSSFQMILEIFKFGKSLIS